MLKIVTLSQGAEKAGGGDILSGKSMIDQHQVIQGIPIEYVLLTGDFRPRENRLGKIEM